MHEILVLAVSPGARADVVARLGAACPAAQVLPFEIDSDVAQRRVRAVVAVLEPGSLGAPEWVARLRTALGRLGRDDGFRVFLARYGIGESATRGMAARNLGDGLTLEDMVQLELSDEVPAHAVAAFLRDLPALEDTRRWLALRAAGLTLVSAGITAVQVACAVALGALCILLEQRRGTPLGTLHPMLPAAAAVVAGLLLTPLAAAALCLPRWTGALGSAASRGGATGSTITLTMGVIGLTAALIYGIFFLVLPGLGEARALFWLGLGGGLVADQLRREGWRVRRERVHFSTGQARDRPARAPLGLPVFTLPLLSDWRPRVFLSYKHGVGRGSLDAAALAGTLAAARVEVFLDRLTLRAGDAWRRALGRSLGGANVVVCFLDRGYLGSPMCRGELHQALWGVRAGGTPVVVLMMEPAIRSGEIDLPEGLRPVLLGQVEVPGVILRTWQDADMTALGEWLTDRGWSSPMAVAQGLVRMLALLVANPLWWLGNAGFFAAWVAAPAAIALGAGWRPGVLGWFQQPAVLIGLSFSAGFVARLVLASRFTVLFGLADPQVAHDLRRRLGLHHALMAAALAALAVLLLRDAGWYLMAWCAVAYLAAFPLAAAYTSVGRDRFAEAAPRAR